MKASRGLAIVLMISTFSFSARAQSVYDQQLTQGVDTEIAQYANQAKMACGNAALSFHVNWAPYNTFDYTKTQNVTKEAFIKRAPMFAKSVAAAMVTACSTPSYKAALAGITQVNFTTRPIIGQDNYRLVFKKGSDGLDVSYNGVGLNGSQDVATDIEKAL